MTIGAAREPLVETSTGETSTGATFVRAVAAEWVRLRTLRSTWCCLLGATGLMMLIGAAAGAGHAGPAPAPIWQAAQAALVPAQFAFLLVVVLAGTSDYATGAIRSTLQWIPDRRVLFAARVSTPIVVVVVAASAASMLSGLMAWAMLASEAEVIVTDVALSLARTATVITFGGALAIGLGLLLRSTAAALTAIFLLMFVLVVTLGNSGVRWLVTISDYLPGRAVVSMLVVDEEGLAAGTTAMVMIGWAAACLAAGYVSLIGRDAT